MSTAFRDYSSQETLQVFEDCRLSGVTSATRSDVLDGLKYLLLPCSRGSNSVMQPDRLKKFECDVMKGHYYPVMPAHHVTTQL